MTRVLAIASAVAALMVAGPAFAQDKTANTFGPVAVQGGASYERAPYQPPVIRQFRPVSPRGFITLMPRESGSQKRG